MGKNIRIHSVRISFETLITVGLHLDRKIMHLLED
jgi:hypothetical protein